MHTSRCQGGNKYRECIKLMIINGLGFASRPLYLEEQFFNSKPIGLLLGRKVEAKKITDDRLGRCLDKCFEYGCDSLFAKIATKAAFHYNVDTKFRHLDTTSMSVKGDYKQEEGIGLVKFGYSKDNRSDLKQFVISLISSQDGAVPLLAKTISGDSSDKTHFQEQLKHIKQQIIESEAHSYYVADSALYTRSTIEAISPKLFWISRVPNQLKEAQSLLAETSKEDMSYIAEGLYGKEFSRCYGGVAQRWLVVFSQQSYDRGLKIVERQVSKEYKEKRLILKKLSSQLFDCESDAQKAVDAFNKSLKYHDCSHICLESKRVKQGIGRPKKGSEPLLTYQIKGNITRNESSISAYIKRQGKFIIASNELNKARLSTSELLYAYKGQQSVERGFRFLKDPLFFTSSVFLKNQERIVALSMIMCLCLLIYSLAERFLRIQLKLQNSRIKNQRGYPTQTPTMRWVFQVFEGIHVLLIKSKSEPMPCIQILNLTEERLKIICLLGKSFENLYKIAE